ncbi:MAG TPA: polysaccharide biosynthesis/export family protein [Steroidobacteraceae bacterium]
MLIAAGALASVVLGFGAHAQTVPADYRLHPADKLDISVWKETEMQRPSIVIPPDGKVSFPLAGQIMAAGRTVTEVRQEIEQNLKKYIPDPVVTVSVVETAGNVAYVIGQVNKPGVFPLNPGINVLQALALAGGGTAFAKLDSVIVLRGTQASQRVLPFRFSQVSDGKNLAQNVELESGDVIVVP